jgi:2-polyprenyl-6-methoxyphenol hydroxylase-like FAD-dependent oxidoreductase
MKKITIYFYLALVAIVLNGCMASTQLEVLKPAAFAVQEDIKVLATINRTIPSQKALNVLEGVLTGEAIKQDREGSRAAIAGLAQTLASQTPRFKVVINHLEQQLEKRALDLGVKKVQGEFKGLGSERTVYLITADQKELSLSYDLLVGADGAHSVVGKCLGIEKSCLGKAVGATALFPNLSDGFEGCEISKSIPHKEGFVRRIKLSSVSIVFIQSPLGASKENLHKALKRQGWGPEAEAASKNQGLILSDIEIALSQVPTFSHEEKSAILVGEAAATASFFQGIGANTAFKAAEIAGQLFEEKRAHNPDAFKNFNQRMKETTDALIEDSAFLF